MIHYNGCSLDPSEIFIKAKMTSVRSAATSGNGEVLANFREIPAICQLLAEDIIHDLRRSGFRSVYVIGNVSEPVCEISVDQNKIGLILLGGLNPVAAAAEAGIEADNHSMSSVVDYRTLINHKEALSAIGKSNSQSYSDKDNNINLSKVLR